MEINRWCKVKDNEGNVKLYNFEWATFLSEVHEDLEYGFAFRVSFSDGSTIRFEYDKEEVANRIHDEITKRLGVWGQKIIE